MCGRRLIGKSFLDVDAVLVGCSHVSGLFVRRGWPLALTLCADRSLPGSQVWVSRAMTVWASGAWTRPSTWPFGADLDDAPLAKGTRGFGRLARHKPV